MEAKVVYFDKTGEENTEQTLHIAAKRAKELGIKTVLVASTRGDTAVKAMDILKGLRVIIVNHSYGFKQPNVQEFTEENKKIVQEKGGVILTCSHLFAAISRAVRNKTNTTELGDMISDVLRVMGEGMKVVCEIAMMAADAGIVRADEEVICVAGTAKGADTAVVLTPVNSQVFFTLRIKELLCKPRF
jgi:uncharacterized protein